MKKVIRLTESDLHRVIKESVKKVLSKDVVKEGAMDWVRGGIDAMSQKQRNNPNIGNWWARTKANVQNQKDRKQMAQLSSNMRGLDSDDYERQMYQDEYDKIARRNDMYNYRRDINPNSKSYETDADDYADRQQNLRRKFNTH